MIKNIFYSLILHFILLLVLFISFKSKIFNDNANDEIAISLVRIDDNKNSKKITKKLEPEKAKKQTTPKKKEKPPQQPKKIKKAPVKKVKKPEKKEQPQKTTIKKEKTKTTKKAEKIVIKKTKEKIIKKDSKNTKTPIATPQKQETKTTTDKTKAAKNDEITTSINAANNLENLKLSTREKLNIKKQLKSCYNRATKETKTEAKIAIAVTIKIDKDGYISSNLKKITKQELYKSDLEYKNSINNIKRALTLCNPMRNLPKDKYEIWQEINLNFGKIDKAAK